MNEAGGKRGAITGGVGGMLAEMDATFRASGAVLKAVGRRDVSLLRGYAALHRAESALSGARERLAVQERAVRVTT